MQLIVEFSSPMVFGNTQKEGLTMKLLEDIEKMFTVFFDTIFKYEL